MAVSSMNWSRQYLLLKGAERRAVQAANDARRNLRYSPGSTTPERLHELDAAARAAQDAILSHQMLKAG